MTAIQFTSVDAKLVLAYNPFDGDFGSPSDRVLKDKLGIARKAGPCHMCDCQIQPGTTVRMHAAIYDGTLMSFRWCQECCVAMATSWNDDGKDLDERFALRRNRELT